MLDKKVIKVLGTVLQSGSPVGKKLAHRANKIWLLDAESHRDSFQMKKRAQISASAGEFLMEQHGS